MKNNTWLFIIFAIFLLTLAVLFYFLKFRTLNKIASNVVVENVSVSNANSYIFTSPIRAKVNGDLVRVTVFLLDNNGLGIKDKNVELIVDNLIEVRKIQPLSDQIGKTVFDLSATTAGVYQIEARVDGFVIDQKIKVTFD